MNFYCEPCDILCDHCDTKTGLHMYRNERKGLRRYAKEVKTIKEY